MHDITLQQTEIAVGDGSRMTVHWAGPADGRAGPGMVVFQEAFGVNGHIRDIVKRFARQGYWAAAPELFHRTAAHFESGYTDWSAVAPHMQAITVPNLEADGWAAYDWLKSQPKVLGERIGAIGFCLGGRAAFIANAALPLQAAASYYGGGIAPDLLPLAAKQQGPILLVWGGLDTHIPAAKTRAVTDALTAAKKTFIHADFSDADHGFFCDERASYNPKAASEAWALTLAFFGNRLGAV